MSEYARVAIFEVDDAALDAIITQINSTDAPPEGVPGTRITVLADRAGGKVAISVRFASEQDMAKGSAVLDSMDPPENASMRRLSVDKFEVVIDKQPS
jgi:hypothetical protein